METVKNKRSIAPIYVAASVILLLVIVYRFGLPISFAYDTGEDTCLPDVHLSLLVHHAPSKILDGDMIYFSLPPGILEFVKAEYVMKIVAGVPGDHLVIKNETVMINGRVVASGFPLALSDYHHGISYFEKDEIIPRGKLFMIGTNPISDDSRYWGYLDTGFVRGIGYKIY
jgi:conjugal transfer pilin signal peptidase TrbI